MKITQSTQSWGNSTGIRLPKKVLQLARWQTDQEFTVDVRGSSVILTPVVPSKASRPSLEDLLHGVTPAKISVVDWGEDQGREIVDD